MTLCRNESAALVAKDRFEGVSHRHLELVRGENQILTSRPGSLQTNFGLGVLPMTARVGHSLRSRGVHFTHDEVSTSRDWQTPKLSRPFSKKREMQSHLGRRIFVSAY